MAEATFDSAETAAAWRRQAPQRVAILQAVTERMLGAARITSGSRVLDIGTGTGDTALLAAQRVGPTGRILGIDVAKEMLNAAADAAREAGIDNVEFRVMNGAKLEMEAQSFDAIIGRHSVQFLDNWPVPLVGFRRVLRPGGRLSFIVWGPLEENPYIGLPVEVSRELGKPLPQAETRTPFSLGDRSALRAELQAASFLDSDVESVAFSARIPFDEALANRLDSMWSVAVLATLDPEGQRDFRQAMKRSLERFRVGDDADVSGVTLLASASH
jgi:SAM-dependent methyltransferase